MTTLPDTLKIVPLLLTALALFAPQSATAQQVVQINRPRSAVAITTTDRTLPDAASLMEVARVKCTIAPAVARDAKAQIATAAAAAVPPALPPGLVLITVTTRANDNCDTSYDLRANLTAAAIEFQKPTPHAAITRVQVTSGDSVIAPTLARTMRTLQLWARPNAARDNSVPSTALQVALPIEHFAPADQSGSPRVALLVSRQGENDPERIELSNADIEVIWRLGMPARVAALTGSHSSAAARIAHASVMEPVDLSPAAAVLLQLSARGDSLGAYWLARQAVTTEPCLRLPDGASANAVALLDRFRPDAHCRAQHPGAAMLRGTLVPGLGQVSSKWRTVAGVVVLGLVAQRLHASQQSKRDGRAYYQQYLATTSAIYAQEYWNRSEDARRRTDTQIAQAGALWLGAMAEAAWHEWRLGRRLRRVAPIALPGEFR